MAGTSLLILIDDITLMLDDVAAMSKLAAKKTAGVLGDDLALNAQQVTGIRAERELPVVWAVAKGSVRNKVILVPAALAISAWLPVAVTPLLMVGGAYLCFEGVEKLAHPLLHGPEEDAAHHEALSAALKDESVDLVAFERDKIQGAVRTDFILSAEIVARLFKSALRTTGMIKPPSIATATPISDRSYCSSLSSAQMALAAGTFCIAKAYALTMKSLTEIRLGLIALICWRSASSASTDTSVLK